ncbi:MAG: hypothetical protein Q8Q06_04865 [bacterium]|nr:hypothetical protein [bacterium]
MKNFVFKRLINDSKDNIRDVTIPPYSALGSVINPDTSGRESKMVIFLGSDFKNIPGVNVKEFAKIQNLCLDYVRRECRGYDLRYKPHPAETDEASLMDLSGFKIESKILAEIFYFKNARKIKYVFAAFSYGNIAAYDSGFNSYMFFDLFRNAIDEPTFSGFKKYFSKIPKECFINSFSQVLKENRKNINNDGTLEKNMREIFLKKDGDVWLSIADTSAIVDILTVASLAKKINPSRNINLIIADHHRWATVPIEDIKEYFDKIIIVPRAFRSMRPARIIKAVKAARMIKKLSLKPEDIIIGSGSFATNCLASYFPSNIKVFLTSRDSFSLICEGRVFSGSNFRTRPGFIFFSRVVEPLLGVERAIFLEHKQRVHNVGRFTRPINDIFDYVWVHPTVL